MGREQAFQKFVGTTAPPKPTTMPTLSPSPATTEAATTETAPAAKTELDSSRIALIAKKEAALRQERDAFKKEREDWLSNDKAKADEVLAKAKEFNELSEKDKIAALKLIGWSETDIFNAMAGAEKTEPTAEEIASRVADEKLNAYKEEQAKLAAETEKTGNEKLIANFKSDIASGIKEQADKLKFCAFRSKEAEADAYQFIVEELKSSGTLIGIAEALEMTNDLYKAEHEALNKFIAPEPIAPEPTVQPTRGRVPISNTPIPEVKKVGTIPPPPTDRRESRSEKRDRLIQAIMTGGLGR